MNTEPIKELDKFTVNDIAEFTDVSITTVREKLKTLLDEERLPKNIQFTKKDIYNAWLTDTRISLEKGIEEINHRLECCRTILKSQERAKKLFNNSYGITHLKFPPALKIYEKLFSDEEIERVKASWAKKHVFMYGKLSHAYQDYLKAKELASYMK